MNPSTENPAEGIVVAYAVENSIARLETSDDSVYGGVRTAATRETAAQENEERRWEDEPKRRSVEELVLRVGEAGGVRDWIDAIEANVALCRDL